MPWIKPGINKIIPSVIWQPRQQVLNTLKLLPDNAVNLDIGAGGRKISPHVFGVDFIAFDNTSIVSDIHLLSFKDDSVDAVFCTGVFEHIENPSVAMNEILRILKPGGIVHLEVPFMQPFHKLLHGTSLFEREIICGQHFLQIIFNFFATAMAICTWTSPLKA